MNPEIQKYIKRLEDEEMIDPTCTFCNEHFYSKLLQGRKMMDIMAPRHLATDRCESGKSNHCSCDICF